MKKRTGGVWQEIDAVAADSDDVRSDMQYQIDELTAHLQAMDKRITEYFEKPVPKKKPAAEKNRGKS